jgi:hypothetical protein
MIAAQLTQDNALSVDGDALPEGTVRFDGLDAAIIGVGSQYSKSSKLVYSATLIIEELMKREGWSFEDAEEYFDFNIGCLWAGDGTPIIVYEVFNIDG